MLATKGYNVMGPGPNDQGSSRAHLTRALDDSLRRLGTDYIDLYQLHNWDHDTPIEESMATLDGFVRSGKVRYIGCSNFHASQLVEAQWAADRLGATPFVSLQPQYSLIWRDIELDILPTATRHRMGVIVWSPLGGGMLTGKYAKGGALPADGRLSQGSDLHAEGMRMLTLTDRNFDIVAEWAAVASELGSTATAVSLAWLTGRPGVTSVIIGPRTVGSIDTEPGRIRAGSSTRIGQEADEGVASARHLPVVHAVALVTAPGQGQSALINPSRCSGAACPVLRWSGDTPFDVRHDGRRRWGLSRRPRGCRDPGRPYRADCGVTFGEPRCPPRSRHPRLRLHAAPPREVSLPDRRRGPGPEMALDDNPKVTRSENTF